MGLVVPWVQKAHSIDAQTYVSLRQEPEQPFTNLAPNDYTLSDVLTYTLDEKVKWRDVFASSPRLLHPPLCRDPRDHQLVWTNPPQVCTQSRQEWHR